MDLRAVSRWFAITLLFLVGCGKHEQPRSSVQPAVSVSGNVAEVIGVEKRGDKVPNFSWKDGAGNTLHFDAVRGKVTLVNFWATWCGPCKRELPDLVALSTELSSRGIKVIGVSTDRGSNAVEDVRSFVKDNGIPYQVVVSTEELEQAFGSVRHHERRASGRKKGGLSLVVRSVRLVAALATRLERISAEELAPTDLQKWQQKRAELGRRRRARAQQTRFRRDPEAFLRDLEDKLTQSRLPS